MEADKSSIIKKIAVSMTKGVNAEVVRHLDSCGITLDDFFVLDAVTLAETLGLSQKKIIRMSDREEALRNAEEEYKFVSRHGIKPLYLGDTDVYPYRLAECIDAPVMIYVLGDCNLSSEKTAAFVGTRKATPYGAHFCKTAIKELGERVADITIVSGLAYGIDVFSHTACLENNIPTAAVLAHGLDMIYPAAHRSIAETIIKSGGALITEYHSKQMPHRSNFLERNRIVAGLCDATIVVESDIKGGAMSTAQMAFSYDREVMALPGRSSDQASRGCNHLIRSNKAALIENASDIITAMNWAPTERKTDAIQRNIFTDLSIEEQVIIDFIGSQRKEVSLDEIHNHLATPISKLLPTLMEMEFNGIIIKYPGNRYSLAF